MADIIVQQRGNPVLFGIGSFNLTTQPYAALQAAATAFFAPETPPAQRRDAVEHWCIDYILCPDTWPIQETVRTQLRATSWLKEITAQGQGALFQVMRD